MPRFNHDDDLDYLSNTPAPVGSDPIEMLMAGPNQRFLEETSSPIPDIVREAMSELDDRHRFALEAKYIWGKSYADIADMLGYQSKSSAHDIVSQAQEQLKKILLKNPLILEMIGE